MVSSKGEQARARKDTDMITWTDEELEAMEWGFEEKEQKNGQR